MTVKATRDAYTMASGLVRDVMTPHQEAHIAATEAVETGDAWNDALFTTDDVSGQIRGATDSNTGRGAITIVINKAGAYVASAPIVDLIQDDGKTVASQFALDTEDRYTVHFSHLDQGRYLVGIRAPGA